MKIDQLIIQPAEKRLIVQYHDNFSRQLRLVIDVSADANVAALIAQAEQKLPAPEDRPDKAQIAKEISTLEARVKGLKESIGVA